MAEDGGRTAGLAFQLHGSILRLVTKPPTSRVEHDTRRRPRLAHPLL